jgi:RNA polymerase sigma-70 factor (ECF subfamily)
MNPTHSGTEVQAGEPPPDDAAILAEVGASNTRRFQLLMDRYKVGLFRYFLYQTGSPHVAEDLAQEVFLKVFKAATAGNYVGKGSVKTWMFSIAGNCLRDFWRASQRNRETTTSGPPDFQMESVASPVSGPADEAAAADWRERVLRAVSELPSEQKQAVYLKFFGGLTMAEVSEVTAAALTTVKARLRYALMKLSAKLGPDRRGEQ